MSYVSASWVPTEKTSSPEIYVSDLILKKFQDSKMLIAGVVGGGGGVFIVNMQLLPLWLI